jgi:hypothetical protein
MATSPRSNPPLQAHGYADYDSSGHHTWHRNESRAPHAYTRSPLRAQDTHTYQWLRDGIPIPGATGSFYVPNAMDANHEIQLQVTVSNAYGSTTKVHP